MLASSSQGANASCGRRWQESPTHRGERAISRKAIAQGRPDALRWTCMLVCALLVHIAHETAGAARTRSSLRPLFQRAGSFLANLGRNLRREIADSYLPPRNDGLKPNGYRLFENGIGSFAISCRATLTPCPPCGGASATL